MDTNEDTNAMNEKLHRIATLMKEIEAKDYTLAQALGFDPEGVYDHIERTEYRQVVRAFAHLSPQMQERFINDVQKAHKEDTKDKEDTRPDTPLGSTYDSNGNVLTYRDSNGYWHEYTYDSNGRILTFKNSDGSSYEYTRDAQGNIVTYKDSDGYWEEYTRYSNGNWLKYTYDSNGRILTLKNSDGYSYEYTRDAQGNILTFKNSNGDWREYSYDSNGNVLAYKSNKGEIKR